MGGGRWSEATYSSTVRSNAKAGVSNFAYSDHTMASTPLHLRKTHEDLDPKGVKVREARDSVEHPNSLGVAVGFDVTGSMGAVPRTLQEKLQLLFALLLRKGYVEDPQILMAAIGDAFYDAGSLQVGQFESDNRIDEDLGKIWLEGGGGGGNHESYELFFYWLATHTAMDCWEKRAHRGYAFIIGDEQAYTDVTPAQVRNIIGDEMTESMSLADAVKAAQQTFDVYYLHPAGGSYRDEARYGNGKFWGDLLGQNYIRLENDDAVCETIALTIGLAEGTVDLDEGVEDLKEIGSAHAESVGKALASVGSAKGAVTESEGPMDLGGGTGGAARL